MFEVVKDDLSPDWKNRGMKMTFENGWTLSIQFGSANYCENRYISGVPVNFPDHCPNAEIAIFHSNGEWHTFDDGQQVKGWVKTDDIPHWIKVASELEPLRKRKAKK